MLRHSFNSLSVLYAVYMQVVEEKRKLFTRMSKYSLQLEEQDSYLSHQRAVDEQRILQAAQTLSASPLHSNAPSEHLSAHGSSQTVPTAHPRVQGECPAPKADSEPSDVEYSSTSASATSTSGTSRHETSSSSQRMQSAYLQEVGTIHSTSSISNAAHTTSGASSAEPHGDGRASRADKAATSLYLKEELSQLDHEIGI